MYLIKDQTLRMLKDVQADTPLPKKNEVLTILTPGGGKMTLQLTDKKSTYGKPLYELTPIIIRDNPGGPSIVKINRL